MNKGYMNFLNYACTIVILIVTLLAFERAVNAEEAPKPPLFSGGDGGKHQYYVSPKGSDSGDCTKDQPCSLQRGLKRAQAGESVILTDGTYKEQLTTQNNGKKENHIVIRAENKGEAKIKKHVKNPVHIKHNYITISGLWVSDEKASTQGSAIMSIYHKGGNHHIIIEDCTLFQAGDVAFNITGRNEKNHHIIFRNNFVDGAAYNPKDYGGPTENATGEALYIGITKNGPGVDNIMIYNNKIRDFSSNGIDVKKTVSNAWIFGNEFYEDVPFKKHGVHDNNRDGLILLQGSANYFYENTIHDCDAGSQIIYPRSSTNSKPNLVYNNVIYNCDNNKLAVRYKGSNSGADPKVFNNTFYNLKSHKVETGGKLIVKNNIGLNGVSGNLSTADFDDSYFNNPSKGDFSLTSSAKKALDKATDGPVASKDFERNQISGQERDYGAFEHGSTMKTLFPPTALRMIKSER